MSNSLMSSLSGSLVVLLYNSCMMIQMTGQTEFDWCCSEHSLLCVISPQGETMSDWVTFIVLPGCLSRNYVSCSRTTLIVLVDSRRCSWCITRLQEPVVAITCFLLYFLLSYDGSSLCPSGRHWSILSQALGFNVKGPNWNVTLTFQKHLSEQE